ncbi:sec-independent translocation protein MttA [Granulicella sp. 5B5]|uniref:Sec-independent protein translocase subunit TatA/TatB n=1 Tax=Granulicella sp. 5B5 TaxID=1617967 RepID=UPI0015F3F5BE|nr:twin-arginine translocase TatA/TatE family subunit [Granulicella sp. 5B5]QMV17994.1 sec-independent translocation protein MttA [Granulicella sp. 5B5]
MPSFSDSIFLFVLALLLFGPKKLPVLAREIGKWVGEFRRASNEFKMQMEEELRQAEQADRLKKIEAIEAAAPAAPPLPATPADISKPTLITEQPAIDAAHETSETTEGVSSEEPAAETSTLRSNLPPTEAMPIAESESGEFKIMPPSTGLPTARKSALSSLIDAIPPAENGSTHNGATHDTDAETVHGN